MKYQQGDLLSVDHGIIVHGCNAQGVMGSGVAKAVRARYPQTYSDYKRHCDLYTDKRIILGDVVFTCLAPIDLFIANAITQIYYGNDGCKYVSYDAIDKAFRYISQQRKTSNIAYNLPVHFPMIGSGLGGGDWSIISAIIDSHVPDGTCWVL